MASSYTRNRYPNKRLSGGRIISPRHTNRRRQAMANNVIPMDIAALVMYSTMGGMKDTIPSPFALFTDAATRNSTCRTSLPATRTSSMSTRQ